MSKSHIVAAQTALKKAGVYHDAIDGDFGKNSLAAVQQLIANTDTTVDALTTDEPPRLANYILSERSLQRLEGVKPDLVRVVKRAIQISEVDFTVVEGLRSVAKQRQNVARGASQTMASKHITGDAVDLVPLIDGVVDWGDKNNWANIYIMVDAMRKAAQELGVPVKWGGAWVVLNSQTDTPQQLVDQYKARKRRQGKTPFLDGVHFELA